MVPGGVTCSGWRGSTREKLIGSRFDVALVDVFLSDEPLGISLGRHIAEYYPGVRLVLMTGFADEADICKAFAAGAYACVAKPFALDDVIRVLGTALDDGESGLAQAA